MLVVPEPRIVAPVSETDEPPTSSVVDRMLPESVAVFEQLTYPETVAPTAQRILEPALEVTPIVADDGDGCGSRKKHGRYEGETHAFFAFGKRGRKGGLSLTAPFSAPNLA